MTGDRAPVFVDCDNTMGLPRQEIDDGLTLLYLLGRSDIELVGVSATHGNGTAEQAYEQTTALFNRLDVEIPIYRREQAAEALATSSRAHENLTVLGLGALTNLAAAANADPGFYGRLGSIVVMGGYLRPLRFLRRQVHELNFASDPAAAYSVLNAPCAVTVMSAQFCLNARFGVGDLIASGGPVWLRRYMKDWFTAFSWSTGSPGFYLWDLLPAAAVGPHAWEELSGHQPLVHLHSTLEDLVHGWLRYTVVSSDSSAPDPRQSGLIRLPDHRLSRRRFVRHCVSRWNLAAGTKTAGNSI